MRIPKLLLITFPSRYDRGDRNKKSYFSQPPQEEYADEQNNEKRLDNQWSSTELAEKNKKEKQMLIPPADSDGSTQSKLMKG